MDLRPIRIFELAAGTGMLGEAVRLALQCVGIRSAVVGYVERESAAAASIVARMEAEGLCAAPIWDDLKTFDGTNWRGCVDIVAAGYPCQPFSSAGKRRGASDPRHLWPEVRRIVEEVQPGIVFFENVANHLRLGFGAVERDLRGLGYTVTPGLYSSAECGAGHERKRLFILGVADSTWGGCNGGLLPEGRRAEGQGAGCTDGGRDAGSSGNVGEVPQHVLGNMGDTNGETRGSGPAKSQPRGRRGLRPPEPSPDVGDARSYGWRHAKSGRADNKLATGRENLSHYAPARNDWRTWGTTLASRPDLAPAMQKLSRDDAETALRRALRCWVSGRNRRERRKVAAALAKRVVKETQPEAFESTVCGMADGLVPRADQLRLVGNGVDPLVAGYAFLSLWACQ